MMQCFSDLLFMFNSQNLCEKRQSAPAYAYHAAQGDNISTIAFEQKKKLEEIVP